MKKKVITIVCIMLLLLSAIITTAIVMDNMKNKLSTEDTVKEFLYLLYQGNKKESDKLLLNSKDYNVINTIGQLKNEKDVFVDEAKTQDNEVVYNSKTKTDDDLKTTTYYHYQYVFELEKTYMGWKIAKISPNKIIEQVKESKVLKLNRLLTIRQEILDIFAKSKTGTNAVEEFKNSGYTVKQVSNGMKFSKNGVDITILDDGTFVDWLVDGEPFFDTQ